MKIITDPLSAAWIAVISHKLRSFLTILGVVIGVAAVIILMSVGKGTEASILSRLSNLGADEIIVRPGSSNAGGVRGGFGSASTLTLEDANAIAANVTNISGVAPTRDANMQAIYGNQNLNVQVIGITTSYQDISNIQVTEGDLLNQQQYDEYLKVALIGSNVTANLFQGDDPLGQQIRMGNNIFTIVGVMSSTGAGFNSTDNNILIPLSTLEQVGSNQITASGQHVINSITIQAANQNSVTDVENQVTSLLEQRHNIPLGGTDDFNLTSTDQLTSTITASANSLTLLLGAIAGISLLVGGIGVMNIMLVSVMERRREIGIRKALGAQERDIWGQFLVDSALLTFAGGIIGVGIGWGGSRIIASAGAISTLVTPDVVALAVGVSIGIGLFFGFYPAWQGSRMDPIQALRSE
jgi:putative ABC transport system permease protein